MASYIGNVFRKRASAVKAIILRASGESTENLGSSKKMRQGRSAYSGANWLSTGRGSLQKWVNIACRLTLFLHSNSRHDPWLPSRTLSASNSRRLPGEMDWNARDSGYRLRLRPDRGQTPRSTGRPVAAGHWPPVSSNVRPHEGWF